MAWQGLNTAHFLRDYWQQKPLVIHQGLPGFSDPISPEELAGLACEPEINSSLSLTTDDDRSEDGETRQGPFRESDFTALPQTHWILTVESVDLWLPRLRELFNLVDFLPDWRIDDLDISYATPNASREARFDYTDRFILQGTGSSTWQLGQWCNEDSPLTPTGSDRALAEFHLSETHRLETGDLLYIPAGLAYQDYSHDHNLHYTLDFRSPSAAQMIQGFAAEVAAQLPEDARFSDPLMTGPGERHPAEIDHEVAEELQAVVQAHFNDPDTLMSWFGKHMTAPHYPTLTRTKDDDPVLSMTEFLALAAQETLVVNPVARLAFHCTQDEILLFCDGDALPMPYTETRLDFIRHLTRRQRNGRPHLLCDPQERPVPEDELLQDLLTALYNRGAINSQSDEDDY